MRRRLEGARRGGEVELVAAAAKAAASGGLLSSGKLLQVLFLLHPRALDCRLWGLRNSLGRDIRISGLRIGFSRLRYGVDLETIFSLETGP